MAVDAVLQVNRFCRERWSAGTRPPLTPAQTAAQNAQAVARRERRDSARAKGQPYQEEPTVVYSAPKVRSRSAAASGRTKADYDRAWRTAKKEGPEALARFKAEWAAAAE